MDEKRDTNQTGHLRTGRSGLGSIYLLGAVLLIAGVLIGLRIGGGAIAITWGDIGDWLLGRPIARTHALVLNDLRLPRVIMALVTGAVLASAGVVYQALLRNPLAGPYTLGVSGGATFGAVLAIAFAETFTGFVKLGSVAVTTTAALAGAAVATVLIYVLARSSGRFSTATLILAGVTLNLIFGSLILLLQYLSDFTQVYEMIRWMMGGLGVVGYEQLRLLVPFSLLGFAIIFWSTRDLDLVAVDPVTAATLGVRVEAVRWRLLMTSSLMTGCAVAFSGPIGFVGLIVPHCVRMLLGASHARVLPASIVVGALFLLACDTLAQNILGQEELPVGVITAMLGGPFFVFLLLRRGTGAVWIE